MDKHGQGTHCTKMGADSLAENTENTPELISPKFWISMRRGIIGCP